MVRCCFSCLAFPGRGYGPALFSFLAPLGRGYGPALFFLPRSSGERGWSGAVFPASPFLAEVTARCYFSSLAPLEREDGTVLFFSLAPLGRGPG